MMKKRKLFVFALASLMMIGCSNDDVIDEGGGVNLNGEAWLTLNISSSLKSRALHNPAEENGTANETQVNTVRVVLFDATSKIVGSTDAITFKNPNWGTSGTGLDGTNTTNAFKVPKNTEKILVILNPSSLPPATIGMNYTDYNAAVAASVEDVIKGKTAAYDNFMMTNARGELETIIPATHLQPSATEAEKIPLELYVDRVVAKVRVYALSTTSSDFALGSTYNWKLNVTNKLFFPVSKRTKTFEATSVWSDRYGLGSYREDPNYDNSTNVYTVGGNATVNAEYIKNYNYYTTEPTSWNNVGATPEYCLENTQKKEDNQHAYTTHAILRAEVVPLTFKLPTDNTTGSVNSTHADYSKNWFNIGGGYYTINTLKAYIKAELEYKASNSAYVTTLTNLVNEYLANTAIADKFSTAAVNVSDLSDIATLITNFNTQLVKITASNQAESVTYYHAGINFYKIMVKHDDDSDKSNNELGEFGVVRNSVYDITVNTINNPGYPIIPEPDPDKPDEEQEQFLSVTININPWTWYTQSADL
ncbi:Mfa1 family fimbria major subunit [Bacteroides sp. 51]|uniref:Mfa1 family fimbria major subunit n=1 Tax=Bacteroides sp. 51 TaxID=2302938 RepID=UPI0013D3CC4F|nr:Mfa1 family fimbria major subunit [Bacteroides sp. 51]NDV82838.1 hypothetical protein [Bacteroides sp. 51]